MPAIVTHTQITELLDVLHRKGARGGVCHGMACMTLQAFFLGGINHFAERLELLGKLIRTAELAGIRLEELANGLNYRYDDEKNSKFRRKLGRISNFWNDINNYLNPAHRSTFWNNISNYLRPSHRSPDPMQSEVKKENWDRLRTDILAFLDGVSLNFSTRNYPELFPEGVVLGQNPELSLSVTWPRGSQPTILGSPSDQGPPTRKVSFSGIYNRAELIGYFDALNTLMRKKNVPSNPNHNEMTGFILSSFDHTIALGYDPAKQQWLLFDSNKLPFKVIKNGAHFAAEIMSSFFEEGQYACFAMECYQTSEHNLTEEDFNSVPGWSELHEVTSDHVSRETRDNVSWLHIAAEEGHIRVIEALLAKGADPNQTCDGFTPLFMAAERGYVGVVEVLLANGADPNQASLEGSAPFYMAAQNGYVEVVKALLANGADPNQTCRGVTPLYIAAKKGHVDIVEVLLKNEAVRTFIREKVHEPSGIELLKMLSTCGIDGPTLCELLLFVEPNREACLSLLEQMPLSERIARDLVVKGILEAKEAETKEAEANERTFNDLKAAVLQVCDRYNEVIGDLHEGTFFGGLFDRYQSEERRYVMKLQQDLDDGLIANIEQLRERITSIGERADWSIANDIFSEISPSRVDIQSPQPQEESPCTP